MKSLKSAFIIFLSSAILLNGCGRQKDDNSPFWDVSNDNALIRAAKFTAAVGGLIVIGCKIVIGEYLGLNKPDEDYITPDGEGKRQMDIIIDALQNKDPEPIKAIFCQKAVEHMDLDGELKNFIDFIDGNIVSYDKPCAGAGGGTHHPERGWIERDLDGFVENIKTDTGKTYRISFVSNFIKENHPEAIGVVWLRINDKDMFDPEKGGYPEGAYYEIDVYP